MRSVGDDVADRIGRQTSRSRSVRRGHGGTRAARSSSSADRRGSASACRTATAGSTRRLRDGRSRSRARSQRGARPGCRGSGRRGRRPACARERSRRTGGSTGTSRRRPRSRTTRRARNVPTRMRRSRPRPVRPRRRRLAVAGDSADRPGWEDSSAVAVCAGGSTDPSLQCRPHKNVCGALEGACRARIAESAAGLSEVRAEPAFGLGNRDAPAGCVVLDLVAADPPHGEVPRLRVVEVDAADRGGRAASRRSPSTRDPPAPHRAGRTACPSRCGRGRPDTRTPAGCRGSSP